MYFGGDLASSSHDGIFIQIPWLAKVARKMISNAFYKLAIQLRLGALISCSTTRGSTRVGFSLPFKYKIRLEVFESDKHTYLTGPKNRLQL